MSKFLLVAIFAATAMVAGGAAAQATPNALAKIKAAKAINVAYSPDSLPFSYGVRYDEGTFATVQKTSAPALRIGDRVQVTSTGIQLLR